MVWDILHQRIMGGVAIEMRVVLIEFGVVFIGGWGYLTHDDDDDDDDDDTMTR